MNKKAIEESTAMPMMRVLARAFIRRCTEKYPHKKEVMFGLVHDALNFYDGDGPLSQSCHLERFERILDDIKAMVLKDMKDSYEKEQHSDTMDLWIEDSIGDFETMSVEGILAVKEKQEAKERRASIVTNKFH